MRNQLRECSGEYSYDLCVNMNESSDCQLNCLPLFHRISVNCQPSEVVVEVLTDCGRMMHAKIYANNSTMEDATEIPIDLIQRATVRLVAFDAAFTSMKHQPISLVSGIIKTRQLSQIRTLSFNEYYHFHFRSVTAVLSSINHLRSPFVFDRCFMHFGKIRLNSIRLTSYFLYLNQSLTFPKTNVAWLLIPEVASTESQSTISIFELENVFHSAMEVVKETIIDLKH